MTDRVLLEVRPKQYFDYLWAMAYKLNFVTLFSGVKDRLINFFNKL